MYDIRIRNLCLLFIPFLLGNKRKALVALEPQALFQLSYLTASFNALPGLNAGTLLAGISISSPVCGLRPLRAARSRTSKLPKPIN